MERIRAFIAIELPPEVRQALGGIRAKLRVGDGRQVKWVDQENMHLTLQFLGNIDAIAVDDITAAINLAAIGTHPFQIEVGGLGVFPNSQRVNIIWVGLTGDIEKLAGLQKSIGANLVPLGFAPEKRPFVPHLTLGRVRDYCRPSERASIGEAVARTAFNARYEITVMSINLMRSQLTPHGSIYSKLVVIPLK